MIFPLVLFPPPGRNVKLNFTLGWEGANLSDKLLESEDAQGILDVSNLHAEWSMLSMCQCLGGFLYLIRSEQYKPHECKWGGNCPLAKAKPSMCSKPRRVLNYPHSINDFIRHQPLFFYILEDLNKLFLHLLPVLRGVISKPSPLLTVVSVSVYQEGSSEGEPCKYENVNSFSF